MESNLDRFNEVLERLRKDLDNNYELKYTFKNVKEFYSLGGYYKGIKIFSRTIRLHEYTTEESWENLYIDLYETIIDNSEILRVDDISVDTNTENGYLKLASKMRRLADMNPGIKYTFKLCDIEMPSSNI